MSTKRYLIYADPHWSQYSSIVRKRGATYSIRLHNLINSLNWVERFAKENNCEEIICAGDFFNSESLNCEEITALQDLDLSNNINRTFIVGNHESNVNTLEFSSTKYFESIKAKVISKIERIIINNKVDLYLVPYALSEETIQPSEFIIDKSKKNVVIAHTDLAGLRYGRFLATSGMDVQNIKDNCTLFLDGHLHNNQVIDKKIVLIGNLTGQNFNENAYEYDHLVYLLTITDSGSIILDPYENPYAMNFYKLQVDSRNDYYKFNDLKQNSVLSIVCDSSLMDEVTNIVKNDPRILDYRLTLSYALTTETTDNLVSTLKAENQLAHFISFAQEKLGPSALLDDELAKLGDIN